MSQSTFQLLRRQSGFSKTFNFVLFLSTACIFSIFCVYRVKSINYEHWGRQSRPGELFWFKDGFKGQAMKWHLRSVIPAGALMPLQFLPVIRQKYTTLHRVLGRAVLILLVIGNITAVIVSPWAFGGTITTQTACVSLALLITVAMAKALHGIRSGNIDVHRAWMLRTWAYAGAILTMRPINIIYHVLAKVFEPNKFYTVSTCEQLAHIYESKSLPTNELLSHYPICLNETATKAFVVVQAGLSRSRPDQTAALTTLTFGAALWTGTLINFVLVEWYLQTTKDEDNRLRMVSINKKKHGEAKDRKSL